MTSVAMMVGEPNWDMNLMIFSMEKFLAECTERGSPSKVRIATAAVVPGSTPTTVYIESPS